MALSKPMRMKCPECNAYIRAHVKETRVDARGIFRRRVCENCGLIIETLEHVENHYKKGCKNEEVSGADSEPYSVDRIRESR